MNYDKLRNNDIETDPDNYEQESEYSEGVEESSVAFNQQEYVYKYLNPRESLDCNYNIFLNHYLCFSAQAKTVELNLRTICFELFILQVNTTNAIICNWIGYLTEFAQTLKNKLITELKGKFLLDCAKSKLSYVIPDNLTPTSLITDIEHKILRDLIKNSLDTSQLSAWKQIGKNQGRSINNSLFRIAKTVLKLFADFQKMDKYEMSKMLKKIKLDQSVIELLTTDNKFISIIQNSNKEAIKDLTLFCDDKEKNKSMRDAFNYREVDSETKHKLRKLENTDYSIFGQSSSRSKGRKRKVVEDDEDVELKSSKCESPINEVSSDDPQLSTHATSSNVSSHCHEPSNFLVCDEIHKTNVDDKSSGIDANINASSDDPQPLTHTTLSNIPLHRQLQSNFLDSESDVEFLDDANRGLDANIVDNDIKCTTKLFNWFENLQNTCVSYSKNMRLNVSFTDHKQQLQAYFLRTCKLAQVRTAFSNLVAEKSTDITVDEIQMFLSSEAYFHLQLPWDENLSSYTKGDGLCLYRSLFQLYRLHSMNNIRPRNIKKIFQEADAKLTNKLDREDFVSFLELILSCAKKLTFDSHNNHGGDLNDKTFYVDNEEVKVSELPRYIKKLEEAIKLLKNEQYTDWQNFRLDGALWGNFDLIKLIPYLFSTSFDGLMEFHGSYYKANDAIDSFAYLICSMEYCTNSIRSTEPISLKKKHLEEVLEKPNIIYSSQHFFPLVTSAKREDISSCITEISGKILKFILANPMPTMTKKSMEVNSMRVTSNEGNNLDRLLIENETLRSEIAKMRNAHAKDRAAELQLAKDRAAELEKKNAALEEQLRNYKDAMGKLLQE